MHLQPSATHSVAPSADPGLLWPGLHEPLQNCFTPSPKLELDPSPSRSHSLENLS